MQSEKTCYLRNPTSFRVPFNGPTYTDAVFYEVDAATTDQFLKLCHERQVSIQAVLSVGTMLAALKLSKESLPQTILNHCPVDMRQHVNPAFPIESCMFGAIGLGWRQRVEGKNKYFV